MQEASALSLVLTDARPKVPSTGPQPQSQPLHTMDEEEEGEVGSQSQITVLTANSSSHLQSITPLPNDSHISPYAARNPAPSVISLTETLDPDENADYQANVVRICQC